MLCQLVCVDRRYQRMNCFNIRELQGILKRKFFTDLVNTSDSHKMMEPTLIGMRHKNNMSNILMYDQSLFYNFDLTNTSKYKNFSLSPGKVYTYNSSYFSPERLRSVLPTTLVHIINPYTNLAFLVRDFVYYLQLPSIASVMSVLDSLNYLKTFSVSTFYLTMPSVSNINVFSTKSASFYNDPKTSNTCDSSYTSSTVNYAGFSTLLSSSFAENSTSWRFNRYSYPLISYDYKSGNYLSIWDQLYPSLTLSFIEVARGIRKAP